MIDNSIKGEEVFYSFIESFHFFHLYLSMHHGILSAENLFFKTKEENNSG